MPLALKDLLVTTDAPTTAASKLLEGYISPYDATVVTKLRDAGILPGASNADDVLARLTQQEVKVVTPQITQQGEKSPVERD